MYKYVCIYVCMLYIYIYICMHICVSIYRSDPDAHHRIIHKIQALLTPALLSCPKKARERVFVFGGGASVGRGILGHESRAGLDSSSTM